MAMRNETGDWGPSIDAWVEAHTDDFLRAVADLVRIPTENTPPDGNEFAGQIYVKGLMEGLGAEVDLFELSEVDGLTNHPVYQPGRNYDGRPNVVGIWKGTGGGRSICFASHMDTAARTPLPWHESTPFSGEIKGDRIYGRGTYDMKGGLIATIYAVRALGELGVPLRGDVLVESDVDEEWGGSNGTLASRLRGHNADLTVIPEPSHMTICPSHLGVRVYRLTLHGSSGMRFGGEDFGNPAVEIAQVIEAFTEFARRYQAEAIPPIDADNPPPVDILRIHGEGYGVPHQCSIDFFLHCFEGETQASLDGRAKALRDEIVANRLKGARLDVEPLIRFVEPSSMPLDHPGIGCAKQAMDAVRGSAEVKCAPFACDGYVFNKYSSSPALVLGPGGARAHAQDEYAHISDLKDLVRVYARMILDWCG